jgi:hypothetical protein
LKSKTRSVAFHFAAEPLVEVEVDDLGIGAVWEKAEVGDDPDPPWTIEVFARTILILVEPMVNAVRTRRE